MKLHQFIRIIKTKLKKAQKFSKIKFEADNQSKDNMEKEQAQLEYTILQKQSYGKDIDHIKEKNHNKKWNVLAPTDIVQFTIKFHNPSFVTRVQAKGNNTEIMQLVFKDLDGDAIDTVKVSDFKSAFAKNLQISRMAETIDVVLKSFDGQSKNLGLNYLLFKGSPDLANHSKIKLNNLTTQQTIKLDRINAPQKSKPVGTSQPYRFLPQNNYSKATFDDRQKRIVKPKIEQKKVQKRRNDDVNIDDCQKDESDTIVIPPPERDYHVMTLESLMPCMAHMNEEWIEAQRKMQEELGVPEEQRLSNYVRAIQLQRD